MTTKATLLSGGDGTAVPTDFIGASVQGTGTAASSTSESGALATVTLTPGRWLVSANIQSAGTGAVLLFHRLYIKGSNTGAYSPGPTDYFVSGIPAATFTDHSFCPIIVDILPATPTKTVYYTTQTNGSTSNIYVFIQAVRIA